MNNINIDMDTIVFKKEANVDLKYYKKIFLLLDFNIIDLVDELNKNSTNKNYYWIASSPYNKIYMAEQKNYLSENKYDLTSFSVKLNNLDTRQTIFLLSIRPYFFLGTMKFTIKATVNIIDKTVPDTKEDKTIKQGLYKTVKNINAKNIKYSYKSLEKLLYIINGKVNFIKLDNILDVF